MDAEHDALVEAREMLAWAMEWVEACEGTEPALLQMRATLAKIDKALEDEG